MADELKSGEYESMTKDQLIAALEESKKGQAGQDRKNTELSKQLADLTAKVADLESKRNSFGPELDAALSDFAIKQSALKAAAEGRIPLDVALAAVGPDEPTTKRNMERLREWRDEVGREKANEILSKSAKPPQAPPREELLKLAGMKDKQVQAAIQKHGLEKFLELAASAMRGKK